MIPPNNRLLCSQGDSASQEETIFVEQRWRQQQQTRPLPSDGQLIFSPQTFLKFRFRVLFWRHSQTQLIGCLNDQIRSLPVPISSRQKHLRHRSQNGGGTEGGLPPAASRDQRNQRRGAFRCLPKDSDKQTPKQRLSARRKWMGGLLEIFFKKRKTFLWFLLVFWNLKRVSNNLYH